MPDQPQRHPRAERVTRGTRTAAAARLVTGAEGGSTAMGNAFLRRAKDNGVDLRHFWVLLGPDARPRQAVLVVPQPGRTAMIFLSADGPGSLGDPDTQHRDRVALLGHVFVEVAETIPGEVALLQALPSPEESHALAAFADAGMTRLGDLLYLRRPLARPRAMGSPPAWPSGVEVARFRGMDHAEDTADLRRALERTYIDTLDCPGLCDMRETGDVIESHRATGAFDPNMWWLIRHEGAPEGCVLLSPNPEHAGVELVYMGLGPDLRGRRLGGPLLEAALARIERTGLLSVNCAVDAKNEPARAMYARLGFAPFAERVAFVRRSAPAGVQG
jgi:GNAT superfamily N-acetyltransferase